MHEKVQPHEDDFACLGSNDNSLAEDMLSAKKAWLEEISLLHFRHQTELRECIEKCFQQQQALLSKSVRKTFSDERTGSLPPPPKRPCWDQPSSSSLDEDIGNRSLEVQKFQPSSDASRKQQVRKRTGECVSQVEREHLEAKMTWLQRFVISRTFEWVSGLLIILNAMLLGWETQWKARKVWKLREDGLSPVVEELAAVTAISWMFSIFFTAELGVRWYADGFLEFFQGGDVGWNIFDIVIVSVGLMDQTLQLLSVSIPTNISVLRVLRVVRIIRVARIIRVMRFFRELRIMIYSILGSFKSLLWVALILALIFYISGITIVVGVTTKLEDLGTATTSQAIHDLHNYFGSLDKAIMSLYMSMSGGNDWAVYYDALGALPGHYQAFFVTFVTFAVFAVVNIVTGVFVDTAVQSNLTDRELIVSEELEQKRAFLEELGSLFASMDMDGTGCISQGEFEQRLSDDRVIAYFRALKLDVTNPKSLFRLLDFDKSGEIEIQEFLRGCYSLQGSSTALDAALMRCEIQYLKETMTQLHQRLQGGAQNLATAFREPLAAPKPEPSPKRVMAPSSTEPVVLPGTPVY